MRRFRLVRQIKIQVRQNPPQRLHRAAVARRVHRREAARRANRREHLRQIVLQPRHQRIVADEHGPAPFEKIEPIEQRLFVEQPRRTGVVNEAALAAGINRARPRCWSPAPCAS